MRSLREFSSVIMQKHLLRAKLRQLVNKARVYGRTPENVGEIKKGWGAYDAMKARAFAAQVAALHELAARSTRVVELARGDRALNWIRNTKLVNPAGKVETMADAVASAPAADRHAFYKSIVHATRNPQDTLNRKIIADIMRGSRRELAARSARVVELARGDYVIKHMKLNPGAWRGATDTKRAAQGKFSQRMTEAIQDVLDDKRKLPFSVSNNRGSVAADYAKQARDEMAMSRKEIAWWLRSQREAAQGRSFRPFSDHLYHARGRGSRSEMF
jgi:hypothetical protein